MERDKAIGLFRLRVTGALEIFKGYGNDIFMSQVLKEVELFSLELHKDLSSTEAKETPSLRQLTK